MEFGNEYGYQLHQYRLHVKEDYFETSPLRHDYNFVEKFSVEKTTKEMIRYIDLASQLYPSEDNKNTAFCFLNTITDEFMSFDDEQVFYSVEDFKTYYGIQYPKGSEDYPLRRFLNLIPYHNYENKNNAYLVETPDGFNIYPDTVTPSFEKAPLSWNYRVLAHTTDDEVIFKIHEVYYNLYCDPVSYTEAESHLEGESREEIREVLDKMREALNKPVISLNKFPEDY